MTEVRQRPVCASRNSRQSQYTQERICSDADTDARLVSVVPGGGTGPTPEQQNQERPGRQTPSTGVRGSDSN